MDEAAGFRLSATVPVINDDDRNLAAAMRSEEFDLHSTDLTGLNVEELLTLATLIRPEHLTYTQALTALQALQRLTAITDAYRARILHTLLETSTTPGTPAYLPDTALAVSLTITDIATTLTLPERTAGTLATDADRLTRDFPATLTALETGTITWTKATTITDNAHGLPAPALPGYEADLLTTAPTLTRPQLANKARRLREHHHPEALTARRRKAEQDRRISFEPAHDGMAWLNAYLPAETALTAYQRIKTATTTKHPTDPRTHTQREADHLAALLLGNNSPITGPGPARAPRAEISVTVPLLTLLGHDIPADLDGYGPIPASVARQLTATAPSLYRLLTHPETGTVLSIGRTSYTIPRPLRRYLAHRDGTCRFPGCNRAVRACDIDHTTEWQHGGRTNACNLAHLCPKHHHYKTLGHWKPRQLTNGTLEWTSPTGRKHITQPRT